MTSARTASRGVRTAYRSAAVPLEIAGIAGASPVHVGPGDFIAQVTPESDEHARVIVRLRRGVTDVQVSGVCKNPGVRADSA